MADVTRTITLDINVRKDQGPKVATNRLNELADHGKKATAALYATSKAADRGARSLSKYAIAATAASIAQDKLSGSGKNLTRHMFQIHKQLAAFGGMAMKMLTGGLKLATLGLGAMSVALVGIHALFIAGRFLVKSYNVVMQGLGATAAGAAVAIGLASTAIREQQAAMFAYSGRNNKEFGSGLNQTRVNMRGLHMDAQLAGAGVESLNKAYSVIAKSKQGYTAGSKTLLKGLGDYAAAGQPLEEGLAKAAEVVAVLQDPKKGLGAVQAKFKEMGPAAEEALKKAKKEGINTKKEFIEAMKSGKLSALGGVTGQFDAVNNTLVGQLKKYFNLVRGQFADFGQQFLPEAKVGLEKMYGIITRTMRMSSGALSGWEKQGGFVDVLVNATQKVSDFYLKLIRDYLPTSVGMFKRLGEWWDKFKEGFNRMVDGLRGFQDGARVIEKTFGDAWRPVWAEIKSGTQEFNEALINNEPAFRQFGESLGLTIANLLGVIRTFERLITKELPFIARIFDGVSAAFKQFMDTFKFLEGIFGGRGAFMALMGMARGLKTNRGTLVDTTRVNNMNVTAGKVNIAGGVAGAAAGARVGALPALAGPTAGMSVPIGGVLGFLGGSGLLGPRIQGWVSKLSGVGKPATGAPPTTSATATSLVPGARSTSGPATPATGFGIIARSAAAATDAARSSSGTPPVAPVVRAADDRDRRRERREAREERRNARREAREQRITRMLGRGSMFSGGTVISPTTERGGDAGARSGSGGGAPPTVRIAPGIRGMLRGSPTQPGSRFSLFSRGLASVGGYGADQKILADKRAAGTGFKGLDGGMASFGLAMLMAKLSDNPNLSRDVAGGLSLAASAAMFSPRMGLGIAGGTLALRGENVLAATGGGALAGGVLGSQFGIRGMAIGTALGSTVGFVNAPKRRRDASKKRADAMVDSMMAEETTNDMVQMALVERDAQQRNLKTSTLPTNLRKRAERQRERANKAKNIVDLGYNKKSKYSFMEMVAAGAGIGSGAGGIIGAVAGGAGGASVGGPAGAAAGAVAGGKFGMVAGAALGAVAGGLAYGVRAGFDAVTGRFKYDREAGKKRADSLKQMYADGDISYERYKQLTKKKVHRFGRDEQFGSQEDQQSFFNDYFAKMDADATAKSSIADSLESRTAFLARTFNKTETEITSLAQTMGVNLADNTKDLNEVMLELGLTVVKTAQQIDQELQQRLVESLRAFDQATLQQKAPYILDEAAKNLRQDYDQSKTLGAQEAGTFLSTAQEQLTNMYGGDTSRGAFEYLRLFGSADGTAFTQKGGPLEGMGQAFFDTSTMTGQAHVKSLEEMRKSIFDTGISSQLAAVMATTEGMGLGEGGFAELKSKFMGMDLATQEAMFNEISSGQLAGGVESFMQRYGLGGIATKDLTDDQRAFAMADPTGKEALLIEMERKNIEQFGKFFAPGAERPEWWTKAALIEVFTAAGIEAGTEAGTDPDTRTPRGRLIGDTTSSRLSQTLARHSAMDSMIAGNRKITSSYRTNMLGSINSDHVTGRAYDLVGNQLGMYKTIVERNGGFAEFHGGSINRHLHVVPGPGVSAPIGDTVSPYSRPQITAAPASSNSNNGPIEFTINVNGIGIKEAIPQIKSEIERSMYEYKNRR